MAPTYEPFWRNEKLDSSDARASETLLLASELLSKSWMWRTFMLVGYLGYREGWQVDKLESRTLRPSHAITTDSRGWLAHHERNPFSLATAHFLSLGPLAHCKMAIHHITAIRLRWFCSGSGSRCPAYHRCAPSDNEVQSNTTQL